jgi:acetyl esterase/lipase
MLRVLASLQLDGLAGPPLLTPDSDRKELLDFCAGTETAFDALWEGLVADLPPVEGVSSSTTTIDGPGGELNLYVHRPADASGPLPCIYHLHGGGMVVQDAANGLYVRWRDELAATGLVVVGVEFRNGAGKLGPHPYPAGLDDSAAGLRWVHAHKEELGVSGIVVSGESGGAGLALALALRANLEGWAGEIAGVYALCPYILGTWADDHPEYPSLAENQGYFLHTDMFAILSEVYDPGRAHVSDPRCWPAQASDADLAGLPPHVISVNELDPLRDEGLAYYRRLVAAGVPALARTNAGLCHIADVIFPAALPDLYATSVAAISGFARSLG